MDERLDSIMTAQILPIFLLFIGLFAAIMMGFPVALTIAGFSTLAIGIGIFSVGFDVNFLSALPSRIFGVALTSEVLIAVPMFIFMGVTLERSRVAEDLLVAMGRLCARLPGGLALSVILVGALLAASTGIVGATVVTMGLLSLPTMLKNRYSVPLTTGVICASGTLGQIIPPSIVLIILGDQISNAYVDAQRSLGNWSPEPVSVGDLFAGAIIPGLLLVMGYMAYTLIVAIFKPDQTPPLHDDRVTPTPLRDIFRALTPPLGLIVAVLGSILYGVATPSEAGAVGGVGAVLLAGNRACKEHKKELQAFIFDGLSPQGHRSSLLHPARLLLFTVDRWPQRVSMVAIVSAVLMMALSSSFDIRLGRMDISASEQAIMIVCWLLFGALGLGVLICLARLWAIGSLQRIGASSAEVSSMIFLILVGASFFSLAFRGLGGDDVVHGVLNSLPGGVYTALALVMLIVFLMGFFLDFIEICFVVVPVVAPVLLKSDISPVWLGILLALNLQTSFLTPPFGFSLFYLRGVAPASVATTQIYRGVIPFIVIQILVIVLVAFWPATTDFLPRVFYGTQFP